MSVDLFKIGAVAKRTGVSPECLRAWERRYGLEPAQRAGRTRFYSAEQVDRLTSIKGLLDQGHPISQIIGLDSAELERRLHPPRLHTQSRRGVRVGVVGGRLVQAYRKAEHAKIKPIAEWATLADVEAEGVRPQLDSIVIHIPSLEPQPLETLEDLYSSAQIVVVFSHATAGDLERCRESGYPLLHWPVQWEAVENLVSTQALLRAAATDRTYTDEELSHIIIANDRKPPGACKCSGALADSIMTLDHLAQHAPRCSNDEDHALIEERLHATLAQLELSLQALVEKEGLFATVN